MRVRFIRVIFASGIIVLRAGVPPAPSHCIGFSGIYADPVAELKLNFHFDAPLESDKRNLEARPRRD